MKAVNAPKSEFESYCDKHSPNQPRSFRVTTEKAAAATASSQDQAEERKKASDKKKAKDVLPIIPTHIFHRLINVANQYAVPPEPLFTFPPLTLNCHALF